MIARTLLVALLFSSALFRGVGPGASLAEDPPAQPDHKQIRVEVARLVEQLDDDQYEVRQAAVVALEAMVARAELGELLAREFQRVLVRTETSFEVRWQLRRWSGRLPVVEPEPVKPVSAEQITQLIGQLDDDTYATRLGATRRLESLLSVDEMLPEVRRALQGRLEADPEAALATVLERLLELTQPAMVAECWRRRQHISEQYLLIGVPSLGPGAERPSHFDRIDDRVAHCLSGNNLPPGDYPVGVAFPHPNDPDAVFHLVNLSTLRRRREYARESNTDEAQRLVAISRRTLDRMLAERHELDAAEVVMLAQLDPKEVSQFAGKYFHVLDDGPLPLSPLVANALTTRAGGAPSRFGAIAAELAIDGTKEAIAGLLAAIEKDRFLPPGPAARYRLEWLAALAIAEHDPWPDVDPWLGSLIGRDDMLADRSADGPRLGATAAAVLLSRHEQSLVEFGLQKAAGPTPAPPIGGFRFSSAAAQEKAARWWQQQQQAQTQP